MNIKVIKTWIYSLLLLVAGPLQSQSYHAINGSPFAGVTGMYNNPATTVNSAYRWDFTLFSAQATISNSLFTINQSSLTRYDSANTQFTPGMRSRYLHGNIDINIFNMRFNAGKKSAFAFGLRARTYNDSKLQPFYYTDTISTMQGFLSTNKSVDYLQGFGTSSGWLEADFNFSHIVYQRQGSRLSAGATVGYMRGISGGHAAIQRVTYLDQSTNTQPYYLLTGGSGNAMYSKNYDTLNANNTFFHNAKSFLKNSLSSVNINVGIEYLLRNTESDEDEISPTNYDWKIGVSIMDIGKNKYAAVDGSFNVSMPKSDVSDTSVQTQFTNISGIRDLRQNLKTLFNVVDSINQEFTISNPTRIIINIDRNFGRHFYVNGELSMNIYSSEPRFALKFRTREVNLLTVTPRWETKALGAYLPIQYNTQGQLWVGGAVKLGPLLLGFHSLDFFKWFKQGTQSLNGGGYLLLSIHPFRTKEIDNSIDCPKY
jgi:hypothetical protein